MHFSKKKFLTLKSKNKAKKIADILKSILLISDPEIKAGQELLDNYNTLLESWQENIIRMKIPEFDANLIYEHYIFWRFQSGLGPEKEIISKFDAPIKKSLSPEANENSRKVIPWQVLLPNLRSGYNVGSIIRTAECFGFSQIHLCGYTPSVENKAVQAASMGTESWMPITQWENPQDFFNQLDEKLTLIGVENSEDADLIYNFKWPASGLLILGNEELGIHPSLLDKCDSLVKIPLYGNKESLNVAGAFSIFAWEIRKNFVNT
jgi:tRNA(Leu) C34 or U34 (ribose-2'-O)-methylase TrmL